MKILFMHINIIATVVLVISALCLESDIAMKMCLISSAYIALYSFRVELMKAIYKVFCFYADALKEAKASGMQNAKCKMQNCGGFSDEKLH